MTNTQKFAKQELDILAATVPDAIVTHFAKEILALCEAFGRSGQSGGSAPMIASAISQAVKKLMLQEPICDVTGHENEALNKTDVSSSAKRRNEITKILYRNSTDDSECIRIRFEDIQNIIDLLNDLYD